MLLPTIFRVTVARIEPARAFSMVRRAAAVNKTASSPTQTVPTDETEAPSDTPAASATVTTHSQLGSDARFPLKDGVSVFPSTKGIDWSDSFHGLGQQAFDKQAANRLLAALPSEDIEIKPDGLLYLPEIKYRRILNRAFGPGGWGLAPRSETLVTPKQVSREYGLVCNGRLVSVARGEQDYFGGEEKLTTALEGCKSNALMRCCKDLGIASELWDPVFIRKFKKTYCDELFAENVVTKKKKKLWKLKVNSFEYPYKAC